MHIVFSFFKKTRHTTLDGSLLPSCSFPSCLLDCFVQQRALWRGSLNKIIILICCRLIKTVSASWCTVMTRYFTRIITNILQSLLIRKVLVAVGGAVPVVLGIAMQRSGGTSQSYPTIHSHASSVRGWAAWRAASMKVDRQVTELDAAASIFFYFLFNLFNVLSAIYYNLFTNMKR